MPHLATSSNRGSTQNTRDKEKSLFIVLSTSMTKLFEETHHEQREEISLGLEEDPLTHIIGLKIRRYYNIYYRFQD